MLRDFMLEIYYQGETGYSFVLQEFEPADLNLEETIDSFIKESTPDDSEFSYYDFEDWDYEWLSPLDFTSLGDYGKYAWNVKEHGISYHLRYEDVGVHDYEKEFMGFYGPGHSAPSWAAEGTYSYYKHNDGVFIFKDK